MFCNELSSELFREVLVTIRKSIYINYLQLQILITLLFSVNKIRIRTISICSVDITYLNTREFFLLYSSLAKSLSNGVFRRNLLCGNNLRCSHPLS